MSTNLIDTNQAENVTGRNILNGLDEATHHENGALDGLDEKILLLARSVVGALNADLETRLGGSREHTSKSVETALIGGRHHLGDVQHEGTLGVTVADGDSALIVHGTLVESLNTVPLGGDGGRKMHNNHLQKRISSGKELAHDNLQQSLALEVLLLRLQGDIELFEEGSDFLLLGVRDGAEDLEDGIQNELVEGALECLALVCSNLGPLLGLRVEVVVTL